MGTEKRLETQKVMMCRCCRNTTSFDLRGYYEVYFQAGRIAEERVPLGKHEIRSWNLWRCQACGEPTLTSTERVANVLNKDFRPEVYFREKYIEDDVVVGEAKILFPILAGVPLPSDDMPHEIAQDYLEARAIFEASARSSAALLRLAIQKLCKHLGQPGKNINDDISALVKRGLPQEIQQALDYVRVIGNNAVHPGEIDIRDKPDVVVAMFEMMNYIVDVMITRPRVANEFYDKLPQNIRKAIDNRDSR